MVPIRRLLYIFVSFVFLFSLTQCEKDDICLNDNLNTPRIIIRFMDKENPGSSKIPNDFLIRAIDNENSLGSSFSDSIALPLYIHKDFTQFEFILNANNDELINIDTIQINYQRKDRYLNSACGFRATFILNDPPAYVLQTGNDWIEGFTIKKDTITDETATHLLFLH